MGFGEERIVLPPEWSGLGLLDIHCAICKDVLEDPRMVPTCEHMQCKSCGEAAMKNSPRSCPTCRTPVPSLDSLVLAPRAVRNLLDKLQIKCSYSSKGCKAEPLSLSRLREHEEFCFQNLQNPANDPKPCKKGCGLPVSKILQSSHVCVAALRQELDLLRCILVDLSSELVGGGQQVVRKRHIEDVISLASYEYDYSEPFAALDHYWKFQYKCSSPLTDTEKKTLEVFLHCVGPISRRNAYRWTAQLKSVVELRLKGDPDLGGDVIKKFSHETFGAAVLIEKGKINTSWGWEKFVDWNELMGPRFMAPDGSVTLEVVFPANTQIVTT